MSSMIDRWKEKELHGRYPNTLDARHIDKVTSIEWLNKGNIFPGFIRAIQDQVVPTRSYLKCIVKDESITTTQCSVVKSMRMSNISSAAARY